VHRNHSKTISPLPVSPVVQRQPCLFPSRTTTRRRYIFRAHTPPTIQPPAQPTLEIHYYMKAIPSVGGKPMPPRHRRHALRRAALSTGRDAAQVDGSLEWWRLEMSSPPSRGRKSRCCSPSMSPTEKRAKRLRFTIYTVPYTAENER